MNSLQTFHIKWLCQQQIFNVCWWYHVSNAVVLRKSSLPIIDDILPHCHTFLFRKVTCQSPAVLKKKFECPCINHVQEAADAMLLSTLGDLQLLKAMEWHSRLYGLQDDENNNWQWYMTEVQNLDIKWRRIRERRRNQQLLGYSNTLRSVVSVQKPLLSSCKHYVCCTAQTHTM